MAQTLAYRIQEREFGGLSHGARWRLGEIAVSLGKDKSSLKVKDSIPQKVQRSSASGAGESHEVMAVGTEYEYRGQTYSSLSRIAREITGTRWPGPLFFGIRKSMTTPRIRCAIYTRKPSEEGLEQSFNLLDAQREAFEAYILCQRHEGSR
jgi:hypothetical protein